MKPGKSIKLSAFENLEPIPTPGKGIVEVLLQDLQPNEAKTYTFSFNEWMALRRHEGHVKSGHVPQIFEVKLLRKSGRKKQTSYQVAVKRIN